MNGLKDNLLNLDTWARLLLIGVFFLVRWVVLVVLNVLIAAQFLFVLIGGEKNENLDNASAMMNAYLLQIMNYQTFVSDTQPWPISEFPEASREPEEVVFIDD
jgi:hypothetical protein